METVIEETSAVISTEENVSIVGVQTGRTRVNACGIMTRLLTSSNGWITGTRAKHPMDRLIGRRGFLKLMGTAVALRKMYAASTGRPVEPAGVPAWQMRLCASSICFSELPIEKARERVAGLGFEAIDIWSAHEDLSASG